ncbi:hypothetical protein DH2020_012573 [Rehmannia glutinosa]|uniref:Carotenoid cleavage dioxygenase n=1 Tax=Rehmannia glutinosa TaxID=99300 RepID=A0ABR0X0G6_REHGL
MAIQISAPPTKYIIISSYSSKQLHHERISFHEPVKKFIISSTAERIKLKTKNKTVPLMDDHNKRKNNSLLSTMFKSIDDFICDFMDLPLRPHNDPKNILSGNLAPVDELPPTACEVVEGSLPSCLDGAYLLNGPNPQFKPRGPYHHFEGDGMIHMIKINGGKATFCSRYVKTYKYMLERDMGYPIIPSPFTSFNGVMASIARVALGVARVVAGEFDPVTNGYGTANTSVAVIGGKLYALGEGDLPYEIKVTSDGDITTLGRRDFHSAATEEFLSMTAHPKIDPETGEAFAFSYHISPPRLRFFRIDSHGKKQPDVPIFSMETTSLIHDFFVTKNYAIFNDVQICMNPSEILMGKPPVTIDLTKTSRFGVIKKYAKDESEMWWVDVPGFNISHAVNAWEEDDGDTLVVVAANLLLVEQSLEKFDLAEMKMEEIRISVKNKEVLLRRQLSTRVLNLPPIHPDLCRKKKKVCIRHSVASRMYGPGCTGNEPFFVPREPNDPDADEDDGFVVVYVHDENTQESKFLVMDAKSPILEIVAAVKLPGRVPTAFHGLFVSESRLSKLS